MYGVFHPHVCTLYPPFPTVVFFMMHRTCQNPSTQLKTANDVVMFQLDHFRAAAKQVCWQSLRHLKSTLVQALFTPCNIEARLVLGLVVCARGWDAKR